MNRQVAALSVDKVQTFLTEVIHSHVQEKGTEDATLQGVKSASYQISEEFFQAIHDKFPEENLEVLLKCSGVYIFRCELSEEVLEDHLNKLFREYYVESQGQKQIRWTYFQDHGEGKIQLIQKAKKKLKESKTWSHIVEKNRDLLFSFHAVPEKIDSKIKNLEEYSYFANDINALCPKNEKDKNRFRIAVIKADLDGMGQMFQEINDYDTYNKISQSLYEEISLQGLYKIVENHSKRSEKGWIFPFYVAGDDIFFAVAVKDLVRGIDVCREMLKSVKREIKDERIEKKISMSIGVELSWNREPIRYYMDMVERQLKIAKSEECPKGIKSFYCMKISMGGLTFFDIDYKKMKEGKKEKGKKGRTEINKVLHNHLIWNYFLRDLKVLRSIRSDESGYREEIGTPHFFYTLLEDITSEQIHRDNTKYINYVLYHLLPRYFYDTDLRKREMELKLHSSLIKRLCKKGGHGWEINIDKTAKKQFEGYLRLMLFFSDDRFRINIEQSNDTEKDEIYRCLFRVPREYLYHSCLLKTDRDLTKVFVLKVNTDEEDKGRKEGYKRIVLDKSMLFRMRDVERIPVKKAVDMIESRNLLSENEIKELNDKRMEEGKLPTRLYFNKDGFLKAANQNHGWNADFIDSLMLFYQYNELVMEYKKKNPKKNTK